MVNKVILTLNEDIVKREKIKRTNRYLTVQTNLTKQEWDEAMGVLRGYFNNPYLFIEF